MKFLYALLLGLLISLEAAGIMNDHLESLKPFLDKAWVGEFSDSTPENPKQDISRWELILNGQAIRILHSVNDGVYGGESIVIWDTESLGLVYYYFTTAGFHTRGTMHWEGKKLVSHEFVTGNENGITEVRSISEMLLDGTMQGASEYLQHGKWVPGHRVTYREDPEAKVIFRD